MLSCGLFTLCLGQIDELKGCIEEREEELSRLRTAAASVEACRSTRPDILESAVIYAKCPVLSPLGGDGLREASSVSVSREREPETEPERHPGPPAAAVHHPLAVQHHAHEGETRGERMGGGDIGDGTKGGGETQTHL